ncbi:MAG: helix-turn-helix transcriptional regulator [Tissierellales bacterium]|nr:helix-turn-helix transcriptional regulator [Tissierellales bacterium]
MAKDELKKLGEKIRYFCLQRQYSQEKLAELSGLHRTYIGSVERGERNISIRNLIAISKALNLPIQDLVKGIDK